MTQTEGEKELVLGNKQLISLFFVVVALCGVFFAMGYMIGRNTSKAAGANPDASAQTGRGFVARQCRNRRNRSRRVRRRRRKLPSPPRTGRRSDRRAPRGRAASRRNDRERRAAASSP